MSNLIPLFIANTVIFLFMALIWRTNDWYNTLTKVLLSVMAAVSGFQLLKALGYIVKI